MKTFKTVLYALAIIIFVGGFTISLIHVSMLYSVMFYEAAGVIAIFLLKSVRNGYRSLSLRAITVCLALGVFSLAVIGGTWLNMLDEKT